MPPFRQFFSRLTWLYPFGRRNRQAAEADVNERVDNVVVGADENDANILAAGNENQPLQNVGPNADGNANDNGGRIPGENMIVNNNAEAEVGAIVNEADAASRNEQNIGNNAVVLAGGRGRGRERGRGRRPEGRVMVRRSNRNHGGQRRTSGLARELEQLISDIQSFVTNEDELREIMTITLEPASARLRPRPIARHPKK